MKTNSHHLARAIGLVVVVASIGFSQPSTAHAATPPGFNPTISTTDDLTLDASNCPDGGVIDVTFTATDPSGFGYDDGVTMHWLVDHGSPVQIVNDIEPQFPSGGARSYGQSDGVGNGTTRTWEYLCDYPNGSYDIGFGTNLYGGNSTTAEYSNVITFTVTGHVDPVATTTSLRKAKYYGVPVLQATSSVDHSDVAIQRRAKSGWRTVWVDESDRNGVIRYETSRRHGRFRAVTLATETSLRSTSRVVAVS